MNIQRLIADPLNQNLKFIDKQDFLSFLQKSEQRLG